MKGEASGLCLLPPSSTPAAAVSDGAGPSSRLALSVLYKWPSSLDGAGLARRVRFPAPRGSRRLRLHNNRRQRSCYTRGKWLAQSRVLSAYATLLFLASIALPSLRIAAPSSARTHADLSSSSFLVNGTSEQPAILLQKCAVFVDGVGGGGGTT